MNFLNYFKKNAVKTGNQNNLSENNQHQELNNENQSEIREVNSETHRVYNLIILDESGSMSTIKNPTIMGFNEIVETIKEVEHNFPDQEHYISLVTFNNRSSKNILWNNKVKNLIPINDKNFQPNGLTPLYDAIGKSIDQLKKDLPKNYTYNVIVTILTDGEENSSFVYSGSQIKEMIDDLKTKSWTFSYIGANHDVEEAASKLSIKNIMRFETTEEDVKIMFNKEKNARMNLAGEINKLDKKGQIQFNENYYQEKN
jgi:Mg-chelatase subunit ChlD